MISIHYYFPINLHGVPISQFIYFLHFLFCTVIVFINIFEFGSISVFIYSVIF